MEKPKRKINNSYFIENGLPVNTDDRPKRPINKAFFNGQEPTYSTAKKEADPVTEKGYLYLLGEKLVKLETEMKEYGFDPGDASQALNDFDAYASKKAPLNSQLPENEQLKFTSIRAAIKDVSEFMKANKE